MLKFISTIKNKLANFSDNFFKQKTFINLLACWILLFAGRMAMPFIVYPFVLLTFIVLIYSVLGALKQDDINERLKVKSLKIWIVLFVNFILFLISFVVNPIISKLLLTELAHIGLLILNIILFNFFIHKRLYFKYLVFKLIRLTYYSAFAVSVLGITKYVLFLWGVELFFVTSIPYPRGSSLVSDYNYYSYFLLLGSFSWLFLIFRKKVSKTNANLIKYGILFLLFALLISSSRRGILMFLFFILIVFALSLWRNILYKHSKLIIRKVLIILTLVVSIVIGFLFFVPAKKKINFADRIHMNIENLTDSSSKILHRYSTILHIKLEYAALVERIWGEHYNYKKAISYTRGDKIKFGIDIFKSSSIKEKIFGSGFAYTEIFADEYTTNIKVIHYDYPHFILLSTFLYSGYIGLLFQLLLFVQTAKSFYFSGKMFWVLGSLLFMSFFFNLFSGNSMFSVPLFIISIIFTLHWEHIRKKNDTWSNIET